MGCDYYVFTKTIVFLKNGFVYKFDKNSYDYWNPKGKVIEKDIIDENAPEVLKEITTKNTKTEKFVDENTKEINITEHIEKIYTKKYSNSDKLLTITRTTTNYKTIQVVNGIEKVISESSYENEKDDYEKHEDSVVIKSSTERGYYPDYVDDDETYEECTKRILNADYNNERKVLYENDNWTIKNYGEYLNNLKCYDIDLKHVRKIIRETYTQER